MVEIFKLPKELEELTSLPNWVVYRLFDNGTQKLSKLPFNPTSNTPAQSNNPSTWSTFELAFDAYEHHTYDGIGFMLSNGYAGIDVDNCVSMNGRLNRFSYDIVEFMDSYTEYSPSRTGVHILFKFNANKNEHINFRNIAREIEIYNSNRFLTITGDVLLRRPILDRTKNARLLIDRIFINNK